MPEADLQLYRAYADRRGLPEQRLRHQVAMVAYVVAAVNGNKSAKLADFFLDPFSPPVESSGLSGLDDFAPINV